MQFWIILDDILLVPWHKEKYNQSVFHLFFTFDSNCFSCAPCSQLRSFLPPHSVIVKHRGFSLQCGSVYFFFVAASPFCSLSKAWRGGRGRTGSTALSLSLIHCIWVIQPTPPCLCCFSTVSLCSSAVPPLRSPPLFWSLIISLSTQSLLLCKSVQCPTLLCSVSFPVFPFLHLWMLPDICCVHLLSSYSQYQAL